MIDEPVPFQVMHISEIDGHEVERGRFVKFLNDIFERMSADGYMAKVLAEPDDYTRQQMLEGWWRDRMPGT